MVWPEMLGVGKPWWAAGCADVAHISLSSGFRKLAWVAVLQMTTKWELLEFSLSLLLRINLQKPNTPWICVWKVCMALKHLWDCLSNEILTSQTLAQMSEVGGWECLPTWHMGLQCVCIFMCVSSLCRLHSSALSAQEQFLHWRMCLQAPRRAAGNLP